MTKLIINVSTGEESLVELTDSELDQQSQDESEIAARLALEEAAATQKASDKAALLERIGITAEEAELLLS